MKKPIAITFALVAAAMTALVGCASIAEPSAQQNDDAAMMLNYPYVNISGTAGQAAMNYPWANVTIDTGAAESSAVSADAHQPSNGLAHADIHSRSWF